MGGTRLTFEQLEAALAKERQLNPRLAVFVRGDKSTHYEKMFVLFEMLSKREIPISLAGNPNERR